ncbi:MAG TPA: hypothetical protein PKD09_07845 [Aggregatilinea sp.]|uniref:hypothetical protein n=1 Tax=Aggregatilinea sp. TaxID=2806333 RepID=UPI002CE2A05D|nr:hypothetical protein [Aggregatilinea sp.]HML21542.1 hypothetical protein [Aggregatilinea sp.]
MLKVMRYLVIAWGIAELVLAIAFYAQASWVQNLWPWSGGYYNTGDLSRLSTYFLSSIFAAMAAPTLWIGLTESYAAIVSGALNLLVVWSGAGIYMLQSYQSEDDRRLLVGALVCGSQVLLNLGVLLWALRFKYTDARRTLLPVRVSFAFFTIVLIVVAAALISKRPNIFPWTLRAEVSVVYGWVFMGAAVYFAHGVLVPRWQNACGQLLGFLAYDIVLILPFLDHFSHVRDENRTSLILYTLVVSFSGLLAIYYLFVHPATRVWRAVIPQPPVQPAES